MLKWPGVGNSATTGPAQDTFPRRKMTEKTRQLRDRLNQEAIERQAAAPTPNPMRRRGDNFKPGETAGVAGRRWIVFAALFAGSMAIYAAMLGWSLPRITADAGGLRPFDMRPYGYDFDEAREFLATLSPAGNAFYHDVQHRMDLIYPALLAATIAYSMFHLSPPRWGGWRWLLALLAVPVAAFDYLENIAVAAMLDVGAVGITPSMVETASQWTLMKSAFTTLALSILFILILRWAYVRLDQSVGEIQK